MEKNRVSLETCGAEQRRDQSNKRLLIGETAKCSFAPDRTEVSTSLSSIQSVLILMSMFGGKVCVCVCVCVRVYVFVGRPVCVSKQVSIHLSAAAV